MGKCVNCGKSGFFLRINSDGLCKNCAILKQDQENEEKHLEPLSVTKIPPMGDTNMYSLEGIEAIPAPVNKNITPEYEDFYNNLVSDLQKKATEHKRNGHIDLAIACLKKSNEIMPCLRMFWGDKTYLRLVEYLKIAGKFDEARKEEERLKLLFISMRKKHESIVFNKFSQNDLVFFVGNAICPYCSIYGYRHFSRSGNNKNFPSINKLPLDLQEGKCPVCNVNMSLTPYGVNEITLEREMKSSNRPFIDERTEQQKLRFIEKQAEEKAMKQDKSDYDWLRENLSEIAPKSFGGYRRMKNIKSQNFLRLIEEAKKHGYEIGK